MIFTLDYVSAEALTIHDWSLMPWASTSPFRHLGTAAKAFASSQFSGHELPVIGLDMSAGSTENLALDDCGLKPTTKAQRGNGQAETIAHPAEQTLGRVHHASDSTGGNISVEVALVENVIVGEFVALKKTRCFPKERRIT